MIFFQKKRFQKSAVFFLLLLIGLGVLYWLDVGQRLGFDSDVGKELHKILAAVSFIVLGLAGLQAVVLGLQVYGMRRKQLGWIFQLPPLESMDRVLFRLLVLSFFFLTLILISSFVLFEAPFSGILFWKSMLACLAWLLWLFLLLGHAYLGWRSSVRILCTLLGLGVVVLCGLFLLFLGS